MADGRAPVSTYPERPGRNGGGWRNRPPKVTPVPWEGGWLSHQLIRADGHAGIEAAAVGRQGDDAALGAFADRHRRRDQAGVAFGRLLAGGRRRTFPVALRPAGSAALGRSGLRALSVALGGLRFARLGAAPLRAGGTGGRARALCPGAGSTGGALPGRGRRGPEGVAGPGTGGLPEPLGAADSVAALASDAPAAAPPEPVLASVSAPPGDRSGADSDRAGVVLVADPGDGDTAGQEHDQSRREGQPDVRTAPLRFRQSSAPQDPQPLRARGT